MPCWPSLGYLESLGPVQPWWSLDWYRYLAPSTLQTRQSRTVEIPRRGLKQVPHEPNWAPSKFEAPRQKGQNTSWGTCRVPATSLVWKLSAPGRCLHFDWLDMLSFPRSNQLELHSHGNSMTCLGTVEGRGGLPDYGAWDFLVPRQKDMVTGLVFAGKGGPKDRE